MANACASALGRAAPEALGGGSPLVQFRQACVDYLVWDLARFEERDQRLAEVWHARLPSGDSARRAVDEALSRPGRSREALARLEAALAEPVAASPPRGAQKSWQEFVQFFNTVWSARRDAIEALLARHAHIGDWRLVGGIDADSILEERRRYQRVSATLPPGASLAGPPPARDS